MTSIAVLLNLRDVCLLYIENMTFDDIRCCVVDQVDLC